MAYVKQNFVKGQILTAEHMNHIEDGIVAAADAQSLGGVAAGSYALKTDVAPDSTMLGGKAPAYYLQPRNLLDNSDFTNPVNQRGQTSYQTPWGMTIDRWYLSSYNESNANLTLATNGIVITPGTSGVVAIAQRIPSENLHANKTYTALAQTLDGTYVTGTIENHTDTYGFYQIGFKVSAEMTLVWATLYEGSYDVSTLPPYVPKGYAAELMECQRYYQKYNTVGLTCRNNGYATALLPVVMRVTPTISVGTRLLFTSSYTDVAADYPSVNLQADPNLIHFTNNFYTGFATLTCSNVQLSADL